MRCDYLYAIALTLCIFSVIDLAASLVPLGKSPDPLGSVRLENRKASLDEKQGGIYGGVTDKPHLGGWTTYDLQGVSNHTWDYMMGIIGVRSLLDIGCGRGISTSYFNEAGARVLCIERRCHRAHFLTQQRSCRQPRLYERTVLAGRNL